MLVRRASPTGRVRGPLQMWEHTHRFTPLDAHGPGPVSMWSTATRPGGGLLRLFFRQARPHLPLHLPQDGHPVGTAPPPGRANLRRLK